MAEKRKLSRRKRNIEEIKSKKRILLSSPEEGKVAKLNEALEDIEVEENPRGKGWLNLSSHKRRRKRSKKRCWLCRSSSHFKSKCPFIKCFYCHQFGYMKINCHKRMIEYMFYRENEDSERKKRKIE